MRRLGAIIVVLALGQVPALADKNKVMCRDGTLSKVSSKACRHHGGVMPPSQAYRPPPRVRPVMARCRDGSVQYAAKKAWKTCRYSGGVARWM